MEQVPGNTLDLLIKRPWVTHAGSLQLETWETWPRWTWPGDLHRRCAFPIVLIFLSVLAVHSIFQQTFENGER